MTIFKDKTPKKLKVKKSVIVILVGLLCLTLMTIITAAAQVNGPWITPVGNDPKTGIDTKNDVYLKWGCKNTIQPYIYNVWRKLHTDTKYEPIPLKDNVKVLNVYPSYSATFSYKDHKTNKTVTGQSFTSILKYWMESSPTIGSDGKTIYGYGLGHISVDTVNLDKFNANPGNYLKKDSKGNYNYDVVMFGIEDANGNTDLSKSAYDVMHEYASKRHGILFGHDTVRSDSPYFNKLSTFVGITAYTATCDANDLYNGSNQIGGYTGTSKVEIEKKGLLDDYPWTIGEIGDPLSVPLSHTLWQAADADGDIWLKYINDAAPADTQWKKDHPNSNFYLTSKEFIAMIQTGHSINGANVYPGVDPDSDTIAKPDEKKLLANTLFYLAQTSEATYHEDTSASDKAAPDNVDTNTIKFNNNKTTTVSWTKPDDNGTTYDYYLNSIGKVNDITEDSKATPQSATVTSGIKGYYYVIDRNPTATASNLTSYTTSTSVNTDKLSDGTYYIHLQAVDNGDIGNIPGTNSKVVNKSGIVNKQFTVDTTAPTITANPTDKRSCICNVNS